MGLGLLPPNLNDLGAARMYDPVMGRSTDVETFARDWWMVQVEVDVTDYLRLLILD